MKTNLKQTYEEFVASRKQSIGGSDIASVMGIGRYACARKLFYDKTDAPKDFDDADKMEFRRGRRLEGIAANYYEEITGREVRITTTAKIPGKPHLSVNIDRLVKAPEKEGWGALEIKVVSRHSWFKIKKEGLIDDYVLQLRYNMAVAGHSWGCYAIYCADLDELMHWDVEADKELGEILLEKADDFYNFHIQCAVAPDALPLDSPQCVGCIYALTCRSELTKADKSQAIDRPDLESLAAKLKEIKGMGSETEQAEEELRAELLAAIKEQPGVYRAGKFTFTFSVNEQKRFSGEDLKKAHPDLYEKFRKPTVTKTLNKLKEV